VRPQNCVSSKVWQLTCLFPLPGTPGPQAGPVKKRDEQGVLKAVGSVRDVLGAVLALVYVLAMLALDFYWSGALPVLPLS